MHVLLVEDDQLIAQGLVAGLELQGFYLGSHGACTSG